MLRRTLRFKRTSAESIRIQKGRQQQPEEKREGQRRPLGKKGVFLTDSNQFWVSPSQEAAPQSKPRGQLASRGSGGGRGSLRVLSTAALSCGPRGERRISAPPNVTHGPAASASPQSLSESQNPGPPTVLNQNLPFNNIQVSCGSAEVCEALCQAKQQHATVQ